VEPDPARGLWLATAACEPTDAILGHASWVLAGDGDAEISVVVADASHGLGIGHDLVEAVLADVRATGAPMLRMDVLASNRRVIGMISRRWPGWPPERDGTQLTYRVPLG
jgi:GNAT superfamily N-acetyltransferase